MESFEELYNESIKNDVTLDKQVTGTIINITSKGEIFVDLGYKADGIIPKSEYSFNMDDNPADEFKIGDKITAEVIKKNDGLGNVLLSYKKMKINQSREKFAKQISNNEIFEGKINQINEKGIVTDIEGNRVFIPLSLSGIKKGENLESNIGNTIKFKIIEYEPQNRKVIGSNKIITDEIKRKEEADFWNNIQIGEKYHGKVATVNSYGAFVDLGKAQGLLHISEVTWRRNANANKYFTNGQEIEVTIKDLDKENKKIQLSYPLKEANPWDSVNEKYKTNDIVKVTIKKFMPFGAFAELEDGVEGLIHISQISDERITKPEDKLELNQKVDAKIIELDLDNKKIGLSIKDANTLNLQDELKGVEGVTIQTQE